MGGQYTVLGSGGYGCVISPAVIFPNSKIVTEQNKHDFVTKLASDAVDEFNIANNIRNLLPNADKYAILPIDHIYCGLQPQDLGITDSDKTIIKNCKNSGAAGILRDLDNKAYYEAPVLCAFQLIKYDGNLNDLSYSALDLFSIYVNTFTSLEKLHEKGIFHLDIKDENLCYLSRPLRLLFADWGLSLLRDPNPKQFYLDVKYRFKSDIYEYYATLYNRAGVTQIRDLFLETNKIMKNIFRLATPENSYGLFTYICRTYDVLLLAAAFIKVLRLGGLEADIGTADNIVYFTEDKIKQYKQELYNSGGHEVQVFLARPVAPERPVMGYSLGGGRRRPSKRRSKRLNRLSKRPTKKY